METKENGEDEQQVVNPWKVDAKDGGKIDYDKLIDQFGCQRLDKSLVNRVHRLTSRPPHVFLRRGVFFAHRSTSLALSSVQFRGFYEFDSGMCVIAGTLMRFWILMKKERSSICTQEEGLPLRLCIWGISSPSCSPSLLFSLSRALVNFHVCLQLVRTTLRFQMVLEHQSKPIGHILVGSIHQTRQLNALLSLEEETIGDGASIGGTVSVSDDPGLWIDHYSPAIMTFDSPSKRSTKEPNLIPSQSSMDYFSSSSLKYPVGKDEVAALKTVENSPQAFSASSRPGSSRGPFTSTKSEYSWGFFNSYAGYPNYMANTESSRAKVRSQSAPRQRLEFEKYGLTKKSVQEFCEAGTCSETGLAQDADFRNKAFRSSSHFNRLR